MQAMSLADLPIGKRACIVSLEGDDDLQQRLMEMGFMPGIEIRIARTAPLGDPLDVAVMGYHLSIRRAEARAVRVEVAAR